MPQIEDTMYLFIYLLNYIRMHCGDTDLVLTIMLCTIGMSFKPPSTGNYIYLLLVFLI